MSEEDQVAEATISDEELELDLTPDGSETEEELKLKASNAEKAKKQILARARKAEAELKALKEATAPKPEAQAKPSDDDKLWEIAEMIQEGFTRADAEFIQKNGGREALKDPNSYVSVAVTSIKEQRRAEQAASMTDNSGGSAIERKYTQEQLQNMTAAELEKLLPHAED